MLTRDTLPAIPADCYWNIEHNGRRRAQPVHVEVRRATKEAVEAFRSGAKTSIPFNTIVAWDYSGGTEADVRDVAERLAKVAREVREVAVGVIA